VDEENDARARASRGAQTFVTAGKRSNRQSGLSVV